MTGPQLPSVFGDLDAVVRRLREWADALDLPRHDEPGVTLEPAPPLPRTALFYADVWPSDDWGGL